MKNGSGTFNLNPALSFTATWKYTDAAPASGWNTASFNDNTWLTANSNAMPAFTAVTRFYRITTTIPNISSFSAYIASILTNHGSVVYVNGQEVYRHRVATGASATTPATGNIENNSIGAAFSFNKFILPTSGSITIAIEIHQTTGSTTNPDTFVFGALTVGSATVGECTDNLFRRGSAESSVASTSSYYNVNYVFNENYVYYYYVTSTNTVTFTYTLPNNAAFWINQYQIETGTSTSYGYPKAWTVRGSNDGVNWSLIDTRENVIYTAAKQSKTFTIRSNTGSFKMYKFEFTQSTVSGKISVGKIKAYACTYPQLPGGLQYDVTTLTGIASIDSFEVSPASSGYTNYLVNPAFPEGLTLSNASGLISGTPYVAASGAYVITATDGVTGQTSQFTINLAITSCTSPNIQIRLRKINKSWASEEKYTVKSATGTTLYSPPTFTNYVNHEHVMCMTAQTITVSISDTFGDGWTTGSGLYVEVYSGYSTNYNPIAFLFERKTDTVRDYQFNLNMLISNHASTWKYVQGNVPANWYGTTEPAGFNAFPMSPLPAATSTVWLFRNSFSVTNKSGSAGIELKVKSRAGLIVYINGVEVHREFLGAGDITTGSVPTGGNPTTTVKSISLPTSVINNGSNTIAIGIVNLSSANPTTLDFDCSIMLLLSNPPCRNWDMTLTADPTSSSAIGNLIDHTFTTHWLKTNPTKFSQKITFDYGADRRETVNKHCIASSNYVNAYDPSDWAVYGSNDGITMTLLGNVTNAYYSSRRQERCFYLPNSKKAYRYIQYLFTESAIITAEPYGYGMSEITNNLVDIDGMTIPALSFTPNQFIGYIGVPFPEATPNDDRYSNFRINPPLQLPLELDTSTGSIRGIPTTILTSGTYTITATDPKGQDSSTLVTIAVLACQYPNIMFSVMIQSGTNGNEMGYSLKNSNDLILGSRVGFTENQANYFPFCQPVGTYTLILTDSGNNGWNSGYFRVLLEDNTVIARGSLGESESSKTVPLSLNYVVSPLRTQWSYYNVGTAPAATWNLISFIDNWPKATAGNFGAANGMTQYFRYVFTVDSTNTYSSVVFNVNTKYGIIVYLNGQQVYTANLPLNDISFNTPANVEQGAILQLGSSVSYAFGPVQAGSNVIAVEVHRVASPSTTDIDFDASVLLTADGSYRVLDGLGSTVSDSDDQASIDLMFDNTIGSTFTSNAACTAAMPTWTFNNGRREVISSYSLTTGPSCNQRHPMTWTLEGSNDEGIHWTVLHRVAEKKFLAYRETASYDFFNTQSYSMYRLNIQACNTDDIGEVDSDVCYPNGVKHFQLAEFALYSKSLEAACPPTEDGFGGALEGQYAYKACAAYQNGQIQALCLNGQLGAPENLCVDAPIASIAYPAPSFSIFISEPFSYDLTVEGLNYSCYTAPAVLEHGIQVDPATGRLFGETTEVFSNYSFTVYCTNANTPVPVSTTVSITSAGKPGLPVWGDDYICCHCHDCLDCVCPLAL